MRYEGHIVEWKDSRGFGFIVPVFGGDQVFVHINSFLNRTRRPVGEELVTYELKRDPNGRIQGVNVAFSEEQTIQYLMGRYVTVPMTLAILFMVFVAGAVLFGRLPIYVLGFYLVCSAIAFFAYAWDKRAAQKNHWRTAESTLHLLGLVGGWPGAIVAQQTLRHKSKKQSFQLCFWGTVILNCSVFCLFLTHPERLSW